MRNTYTANPNAVPDTESDGRTITEMYRETLDLVRSQGAVINKVAEDVVELKRHIADLKRYMAHLKGHNAELIRQLSSAVELLQGHDDEEAAPAAPDPAPAPAPAAAPAILLSSYSDLMRSQPDMSVRDIAFNWFRYDARQLYQRERVASVGIAARRLRNHFSIIKSTMHVVVKSLPRYPADIPSDPSKVVPWEKALKSDLAAALASTTQSYLGPKALNKSHVKQLLGSFIHKSFPQNTPPDIEAFFLDQGTNKGGKRGCDDKAVAAESNRNQRRRHT